MEYIIVRYPTHRQVNIDGESSGFTNVTLMVEAGHHQIDLGGEVDYCPEKPIIMIENTDPNAPMEIDFVPLEMVKEESDA